MGLDHRIRRFLDTFYADTQGDRPASRWCGTDTERLLGRDLPEYTDFVASHAKQSYGHGLLRFLLPEVKPSLLEWNSAEGWSADWPVWANRLRVFAYDWLGRQIAFDLERLIAAEPAISILEPGTGQLLEVPLTFADFIGHELVDYPDAAVARDFYQQWRSAGGAAPRADQCIGYRQPLFLGGRDDVGNLELTDLAVYVSMAGQMFEQVQQLPPGTQIAGVRRIR